LDTDASDSPAAPFIAAEPSAEEAATGDADQAMADGAADAPAEDEQDAPAEVDTSIVGDVTMSEAWKGEGFTAPLLNLGLRYVAYVSVPFFLCHLFQNQIFGVTTNF